MRLRLGRAAGVLLVCVAMVAACSSGGGSKTTSSGKVELAFWSWVPNLDKVVDLWNSSHPDIHVTVSKQAQGDEQVTKLLTANKGGAVPDLAQVEYQALPTLVSNDVLADIAKSAGSSKSKFSDGIWQTVTLGSSAVYAIPQDIGPLMFYYRSDVFSQMGLTVPKTWDEFAQVARTVRQKNPKIFLSTFSATDPGWFAGLSQQAGASWWSVSGDTWKVSVNDAATKKVADFWGGLVAEGAIDKQPMYTPEWNNALNTGALIAWPSAVWGPGVLADVAASTKGKWAMAPLPQWSAGENKTGNWGGSTTAVMAKSKHQAQASQFAVWLNTDPQATAGLVQQGSVYPAARDAQSGPALQQPPAFFAQQTDFYTQAKAIADTVSPFTWGPNVNVTYSAYKDSFTKAITAKSPFSGAVDQMQDATVTDMKKNGFKVAS